MNSKVRLLDNSLWGGVSATIKMISSVIVVFILIDLLGASSFGVVTIISTVTSVWMIANSGFYLILVRRLIHARNHDDGGVANLIITGFLFTITSICLLLILFQLFIDILTESLFVGNNMPVSYDVFTDAFGVAVYVIAIRIVIDYISALFEGEGRFATAAKLQISSPIMLLIVTASCLTLKINLSIDEYFIIMLICLLIELTISIVVLFRTRTVLNVNKGSMANSAKLLMPMLSESMRIQTANILSLFVDPFNKLILHNYIGPVAVTSYEVAMRVVNAMRGIFSAAFRSFMQISTNLDEASEKYGKLIAYIFSPALILHFILLVVIAEIICRKFIDIPFDTIYLLLIALPISMAIVVVSPLYSLLLGIGDLKYIMLLHLRLAIFNALGATLLLPIFGVVAPGIALFFVTLYNAYSIYSRSNSKHIRLPLFASVLRENIRMSGVALCLTSLSMFASLYVNNSWSILATVFTVAAMFWLVCRAPLVSNLLWNKIIRQHVSGNITN